MRFETSQHMRLGQQMRLAPRMIQSMEILQMPLTELQERIEQELESNATLERAETEGEAPVAPEAEASAMELRVDDTGEEDFARLDAFVRDNPEATDGDEPTPGHNDHAADRATRGSRRLHDAGAATVTPARGDGRGPRPVSVAVRAVAASVGSGGCGVWSSAAGGVDHPAPGP